MLKKPAWKNGKSDFGCTFYPIHHIWRKTFWELKGKKCNKPHSILKTVFINMTLILIAISKFMPYIEIMKFCQNHFSFMYVIHHCSSTTWLDLIHDLARSHPLFGHAFLAWHSLWRLFVYIVQYSSSWKFHQLAAGQLLSGQPVLYGKGRQYGLSITY
jgi:hypothetical protein